MEKLPEYWCIESKYIEVCEYFDKQRGDICYIRNGTSSFDDGYLHSHNNPKYPITGKPGHRSASYHDTYIRSGYTQITLEDFKRFILSKSLVIDSYSII